jgi:hypothetical protein
VDLAEASLWDFKGAAVGYWILAYDRSSAGPPLHQRSISFGREGVLETRDLAWKIR